MGPRAQRGAPSLFNFQFSISDVGGGVGHAHVGVFVDHVLTGVARGHTRFSELKVFLYEITEKMLASGLARLTELRLVERIDRFGYSNRAEYHITRQGVLLFNVIFAMQEWGNGYRQELTVR